LSSLKGVYAKCPKLIAKIDASVIATIHANNYLDFRKKLKLFKNKIKSLKLKNVNNIDFILNGKDFGDNKMTNIPNNPNIKNNIEITGSNFDWCYRDKCTLTINYSLINIDEIGEFVTNDDAPKYGCASFYFQINKQLLKKLAIKYNLNKQEIKLIETKINDNWTGDTCAMCE